MAYQLKDNDLNFKKDVVYRFLNSMTVNWRTFLLTLASSELFVAFNF